MVEPTEIPLITLTDKEAKLFDTLTAVLKEHNLKTVLRVNGGWVRDKLMGIESDDIDIALDDMYGQEFARLISEHLNKEENSDKKRYGVIKANSDKSKHLETATIRVGDVFIDLVNLRSETYSEDSRVPEIEIGTPEQDAFRRDLTINSMFYNINTEKVEDYTGKGLIDLKKRVLRTPLDPLQTFLDDPLRLLRTVRFANRFGFEIAPEIAEAAKNAKVRDSLQSKVSFERLGIELDKMFEGRKPQQSVHDLHRFDVLSLLYKFPKDLAYFQDKKLIDGLIQETVDMCQVVGEIFEIIEKQNSFAGVSVAKENLKELQLRTFYATLLQPFYQYEMPTGKQNKMQSVALYVLQTSLKRPNDVQKFVLETCAGLEKLPTVSKDLTQENQLALGWFLKEFGPRLTPIQIISVAKTYIKGPASDVLLGMQIEKQTEFNKITESAGLANIYYKKPLIDGKTLCQMYEVQPGKIMKPLMDELNKFQILNPKASVDDCIQYMDHHKDFFLAKYNQ